MNSYMMRCAIWYLLYNLKKVKNTHGGVFLSVKLQALSMGVFHVFQITQMVPNRAKNHIYISMTKFYFSYFSKANRGSYFWSPLRLGAFVSKLYNSRLWLQRLRCCLLILKYPHCTKMKFFIKNFLSKCDQITFTEEILNGKLHFFCNASFEINAQCYSILLLHCCLYNFNTSKSNMNICCLALCSINKQLKK